MYSGKNKGSLATTPSGNKSLSQTSETLSGTASYKILAHEDNKVNIKENDNVSDIKYATDDTIQSEKYDNLETLDDKEIKVYNKRGWAYGLFNREDMKLLNEKFSELDRRLNSRTDNMLADGTRIVEVNNKIVSIGGTYNDPEIYSVLLINAENETYAEYVKEEILGYVNEQRNYSRRKYEEIWETTPFVYGEENIRHYNAYDYIYKKGGDDTGLRATLPGDFSRYGYNKESNIRGTSDANAKGEVSAVQLDEDTSDIKYATDDTINDWLDDESTPQGIDYEKAVEKNPVIAVAKIYKSAAQTAKSGLAQGKNVKLDEKEYLRIAGSIMQTYGIKGKYNPNYKKELASQLKNFVDSIGKKDANFTDLFEELVNDCKGGILLSGEYDTTLMKDEREFVLDLIHDKTLFIRPRDIQQIEEDYGSVANYRVALELNPTDRGGKNLNVIKVASAYGKDVDLQGFINKSKILYVEPNKERTHNWLTVNRLKLPLPSTRYGFFNNSISQSENNVNTKNDESGNDIKYSMGGLKAETADKSALEKAMELEKDGTNSEKIRKETGWFKGYDGKWRFEIDNSELEFKTDIEKNRAAAIELAKMKVKSAELEEKIVNNTATKAEENEYYNLDEKMIEYRKGVKLSDVINHPKLFEAYPQLKNVDVYYEISSVNRGVYSSNGNVIMLNPMHTIDEQKEAIIHEIQHAIQEIENFANGSNLEYWKNLGYSDEEAMAMYYNTAGEREARDVSARRDYNAEQRKNIRPDIDRKDVVFANSGDPVYSADENIMQNDFEEKVDQIENNTYNSNDVVIMGRTPKVLQDIGFNSLPVAMTKNHIYSVAVSEARAKNEGRYKKNTNYHDLGFNTVKQIYNKISDPLMVIAHPDFTNKESRDSTHKVIALVDLSVNNKQVIAPIVVDFESRYNKKIIDVNLVATYFNKNSNLDKLLDNKKTEQL